MSDNPEPGGCEVSVVMPCLNEAETLVSCITKARAALDGHGLAGEIIVADNGSTDGSRELAAETGGRVVPVGEKGYGSALRGGITAAKGTYIVMGDADDSYDFGELPKFVDRLRKGDDLVMGCRLPSGGGRIEPGAMPFLHRWLGNPVLSFIGRLLFGCPVKDFHCGLRAFRKSAYNGLNLRTTGMEFASEMVIKATLHGLRIGQVPITLHPDGRSRPPHLRTWRDGWRHLRFMLLFSPMWLFLVPGLVLTITGLVGCVLLIPGPFVLGQIRFETNTLLVSAMGVILGVQAIYFALITRTFSANQGLMPPHPVAEWLAKTISLEVGMVSGLLVALIGLALLGWAVWEWRQAGFGDLSYPQSLRRVIPAVSLMVVGVQMVFNSFFSSIITLKHH